MKRSNRVNVPNRDSSYEKRILMRGNGRLVTLELEWVLCTSSRLVGTVHLAYAVREEYSYISCLYLIKHGQIGDLSSCLKILPPHIR